MPRLRINMDEPTRFNRLRDELEEFLMMSVCVAGKSAHVQARRLERFLYESDDLGVSLARSPFDAVRVMVRKRELFKNLVRVGMGKYQLITLSFRTMVSDPDLDLWKVSWQRLTEIPGIREKTAKFFVLHSQADARVAVLDTHMHKKLKAVGYSPPPFPPSRPEVYAFWELIVLSMADEAKLSPAAFDLRTWKEFRRPPSPPQSQPGPPVCLSERRLRS